MVACMLTVLTAFASAAPLRLCEASAFGRCTDILGIMVGAVAAAAPSTGMLKFTPGLSAEEALTVKYIPFRPCLCARKRRDELFSDRNN